MLDRFVDVTALASRRLPPLRGRGRVALALQQRVTPRRDSWTINMRRGHRMIVPANSAQSWRAAFTGSYDDEEIALLLPHIRPNSLVLDVGASLGFYTIPLGLAAREVGAQVLAVEPVPRNCDVIQGNLELNDLGPVVTVLRFALGSAAGEVMLHVESGGTGNATVVTGLDPRDVERHDAAGNTGSAEPVQMRRLDDLAIPAQVGSRRCSLLKIDAEGYEMDILAGAGTFVAEHRPAIYAEFNSSWLETRGVSASAPGMWAAANGYVCHELVYRRAHCFSDLREASLMPLVRSDRRRGSDLLLLPAGQTEQPGYAR